jgi:hypothetical protein
MPPSSDDLPGKKPPQRRARGGAGKKRKPGKQPGAPGAYLAWNARPDTTEDVFPEGRCECGSGLASARDLGVADSHQVTDLPEARAETTQYDRHEVECPCGRRHVAGAPPEAAGVPGTVTYGLNFQAWCVFLMVMHGGRPGGRAGQPGYGCCRQDRHPLARCQARRCFRYASRSRNISAPARSAAAVQMARTPRPAQGLMARPCRLVSWMVSPALVGAQRSIACCT